MNPTLVAVSGPLAGRVIALGAAPMTLGRERSNGLSIHDSAVSRHHCVIEPAGQGFVLRDLESRHGTFVNGVPVRERVLEHGDLITLGASLFLFRSREGEPQEGEPAADRGFTARNTVQLAAADGLYARPEALLAALPPGDRVARDLHALLRIGEALHSLRATAPLARRLLELLLETTPAERAGLLLLETDGDEPAASFFLDRRGSEEPFPISRTLVRRIVAERSALLANDVLHSHGWSQAESLLSPRIESLVAAPLQGPERPLGALYVDTRKPEVRFDAGHLELLAAVAGIAAMALGNARQVEWLEAERRRLAAALDPPEDLVGESPRMREVWRLLSRAAPTDSTVLIRGESGTGKELAARALHRGSARAGRPFVAINCATLSETLLESELFGHEKGAFTGAFTRKAGKFELAHTGTIFLDEVGEIPPGLQAKLLRVLQEREFERVGGTRPVRVDTRVIAATNRDVEKGLRDGTFREDLYYRLNVISFTMPPLRDRTEDIPLLASHFAARLSRKVGRPLAGFTPEARACLLRYPWPGNVRELANAVERAVVLGEGELLRPEDLPESVLETAPPAGARGGPEGLALPHYHDALNEMKKRLILAAVEQAGGNVTRAAERLGLHPNYLHRLIRNLGLRELLRS